jgi:hypothetical protein
VSYNYVAGKAVVREGQFVNLNLEKHIERHNQAANRLVLGE